MKYNLDNLVLELENLEKEMSNPDKSQIEKKWLKKLLIFIKFINQQMNL